MLRAMATLYYTNVRVLLYLFSLLFCVCLFFFFFFPDRGVGKKEPWVSFFLLGRKYRCLLVALGTHYIPMTNKKRRERETKKL